MKLRVKNNGNEVVMPKAIFDKLPKDQKNNYLVLDTTDNQDVEALSKKAPNKAPKPPTGQKEVKPE